MENPLIVFFTLIDSKSEKYLAIGEEGAVGKFIFNLVQDPLINFFCNRISEKERLWIVD